MQKQLKKVLWEFNYGKSLKKLQVIFVILLLLLFLFVALYQFCNCLRLDFLQYTY